MPPALLVLKYFPKPIGSSILSITYPANISFVRWLVSSVRSFVRGLLVLHGGVHAGRFVNLSSSYFLLVYVWDHHIIPVGCLSLQFFVIKHNSPPCYLVGRPTARLLGCSIAGKQLGQALLLLRPSKQTPRQSQVKEVNLGHLL